MGEGKENWRSKGITISDRLYILF